MMHIKIIPFPKCLTCPSHPACGVEMYFAQIMGFQRFELRLVPTGHPMYAGLVN